MIESFCGGLGSAAFLSFLMHVCEKEHAAVQYAALSAVFALSRDVAGAISGWATTHLGYTPYFVLTFFLAFPALALLPIVRTWIRDSDRQRRLRAFRRVRRRDESTIDPILQPPAQRPR